MENNTITIRINCQTEEVSSIYIVTGTSKEEIGTLIDSYNSEYNEGTYELSCIEYLKEHNINIKNIVIDAEYEI